MRCLFTRWRLHSSICSTTLAIFIHAVELLDRRLVGFPGTRGPMGLWRCAPSEAETRKIGRASNFFECWPSLSTRAGQGASAWRTPRSPSQEPPTSANENSGCGKYWSSRISGDRGPGTTRKASRYRTVQHMDRIHAGSIQRDNHISWLVVGAVVKVRVELGYHRPTDPEGPKRIRRGTGTRTITGGTARETSDREVFSREI
ncbi:hypothetical protein BV22DRAFT_691580 [Leucogyrophana mollusca]|uniref:Uncharacterized protein n=1 Tax=Leucogyrophana mollusca TaxID=85980 RepID=A0ACB8B9I1_9AGAM|nr:hypothetical protein BV22DRAFT_691580 [Leucogyrophana mollusca]